MNLRLAFLLLFHAFELIHLSLVLALFLQASIRTPRLNLSLARGFGPPQRLVLAPFYFCEKADESKDQLSRAEM